MSIFRRTRKTRILSFIIADIILISLSVYFAYFLRFDGMIPNQYFQGNIQATISLTLAFCIPIFYYSRMYFFSWSYVSTEELISLFKALTLSFLLLGASLFVMRDASFFQGFPRSVLFVSYVLIFLSVGAVRFAKRVYLQSFHVKKVEGEKTLIIGAGDVGEQILRSMLTSKKSQYAPVGFMDDSIAKEGVSIHGLEVLGKIDSIPEVVKDYQVTAIIIALPSENNESIERAVDLGREAGLKEIKIVPPLSELVSGKISLGALRDVRVGDLLGRDSIEIDTKAVGDFIENKVVLITGAAGSIGSELSRQIANFKPSTLLILDQDETGMFNISNELEKRFPELNINSQIVDIRDRRKIEEIFNTFRPKVVFHAAAYKHVPLMEKEPDEAVKNNILGTKILAEVALEKEVEKFVFISTDKAVNPTSVMGATKRVGEMICHTLNQKNGTKFVSVRFGNVLDSRGSVIPIFREQIKKGGPVEVTHPEMKRYFMLIPEACLLVMQAAEMGKGGEVFVLNMGKPVKILDLAKEMIRLSGYEPDVDIPIVFIGIRPGEKLSEEILTAEEGTLSTENQNIFVAKQSETNEENLKEKINQLKEKAEAGDKKEVCNILKGLVPFYNKGN